MPIIPGPFPILPVDDSDSAPAPLDYERRHDRREWRTEVNERLDKGAAKIDSLEQGLKSNTEATQANSALVQKVQTDTSELVTIFKSFQGAFAVFNMIGKLAKPLGYIVVAVSAIVGLYHAWKYGTPPPPP